MASKQIDLTEECHREWNTTPDIVNHSQAGNVFMLGAGGVVGESALALRLNFPEPDD